MISSPVHMTTAAESIENGTAFFAMRRWRESPRVGGHRTPSDPSHCRLPENPGEEIRC